MIAYHGTNRRSANKIVGPPTGVKVNLGGGELGRGFYLGENVSLAGALAVGKYGQANAAVVKCDLDDASYIRLNIKNIHHRPAVIRLWRSLVRRGKHVTHRFNVDVVCAPFATIDYSYQYKFESVIAEALLNSPNARMVIL